MSRLDDKWIAVATVSELLSGYARILTKLNADKVVRSNNAPAGDYAELLAAQALQADRLALPNVASYDLISPDWGKVQVKARVVSDPPRSDQLGTSPFRSWGFDHACLVQFQASDYSVRRAVMATVEHVRQRARHSPHVNGWVFRMTPALLEPCVDVTDRFLDAARRT